MTRTWNNMLVSFALDGCLLEKLKKKVDIIDLAVQRDNGTQIRNLK